MHETLRFDDGATHPGAVEYIEYIEYDFIDAIARRTQQCGEPG